MKTLFFSLLFCCAVANIHAQAGSFSYTNGATNTIPGQPNQPAELYNGVPSGESNQINTNTVIVPNSSFITTPTTNINSQPAINTGLNNPNSISPTNSVQSSPSYGPQNNVNRLSFFQDPMKTPKHPNQATHVGTVDGSSGKFKNPHVDHHKQSSFAHNSHHLKKAKSHKEKTSGTTYESTSGK